MEVSEVLNQLPKWSKILTAAVAIGALFIGAYGHFTTDAEAAEAHAAIEVTQKEALKNDRIDRARREQKRLELRLIEDADEMAEKPAVKARIERDIADYKALVACIKAETC